MLRPLELSVAGCLPVACAAAQTIPIPPHDRVYNVTDAVETGFDHATVAPGTVQFTDTTTPPATSWAWDFEGDGAIDSTVQSPVPVPFALDGPLHIAPGRYSMGLFVEGAGVTHTTGNGTNEVWSNADLTITCGGAKSVFNSTFLQVPRVWNGALVYDDCATAGLAGYGHLGNGCPGSLGQSRIVPTGAPVLGGMLSVVVDRLPGAAVMLLGLSRTSSAFGPLPFDLSGLGAPGCSILVSSDANTLLLGTAGTATYQLAIPAAPVFLCAHLYNQALVLDAGANALGAVMSDAGAGVVGNQTGLRVEQAGGPR